MSAPIAIIGFPWFRREDYPALLAIFPDRDDLHAKWEDWQRAAITGEYKLKQQGKRVVRAEIRPEQFTAWCTGLDIPADAAARIRWANEAAMRETRQQH